MEEKGKNLDKLMKVLQIISFVIIIGIVIAAVIMMKKYNISLKNSNEIAEKILALGGSVIVVALLFIAFSIVKSFALVFPPAVIYAVSGLVFDKLWVAYLVDIIGTALSLILPYFLGKFSGASMVDTMKKRFKAVQKIDDFAGENDFSIVFLIKASGCMPSDVSSFVFGAMNISFKRYFIASNVGMLPLILLWTLLGAYGDVTNPLSFLIVLPILIFAIVSAFVMKRRTAKKNAAATEKAE